MKTIRSMNKRFHEILLSFLIVVLSTTVVFGQTDSVPSSHYDGLSLKDLLSIKIVSASKNAEPLFDAPLSASVITKEDIIKAGCTSIMEALRLVPGMIVRQQNNGNYDIHLRGMDNVPPNAPFEGNATTTLVMLDNRPIYNYLKGGTFWETLPVDINDVEKIEIIRGPAAALYGPNAVSGVINIITHQLKKNGLYLIASTTQGSNHTFINNASVGYKSGKWSIIGTGNYQHRDRTQSSYFELNRNRLIDHPSYFVGLLGDTVTNINQIYPNQELAMKKYGTNVFVNYNPLEKIKINFAMGIQHSVTQTVSSDNGITPFSTVGSDSRYVDLRANLNAITAQVSFNAGTQNTNFNPGNKYDFNTLDANVEYNYIKGRFTLRPGLSYRSAVYDDTKYSDYLNKQGIFNARGRIITQSASLRSEYKLADDKLRLIAGISAGKFNYPDSIYISYEFAATYKLNKNNLFRAVYSRSSRSSTIYDSYIDQIISYFPTGVNRYMKMAIESNKDLKLLTADMMELGYRGRISSEMSIDIEVFDIYSKNYSSLVGNRAYIQLNAGDTILVVPYVPTNLPLTLRQRGITASFTYDNGDLQIKPFITFQQSRVKNHTSFLNTPDAPPGPIQVDPLHNNIYSGIGTVMKLKSTPTIFGGAVINYRVGPKISCNMSMYYYTRQTYYHASNIVFNDGIRGIDQINPKLLINTNVRYEPVNCLSIMIGGKNILNDKSREFFHTDKVPFEWLAGIKYQF